MYFGLSFTSTYLIPSGATIAIDGNFIDRDDAHLDLWSSHSYSSSSVSSGILSIVLDEDLAASDSFEIVLDLALDISSTATSVDPVLVTVTCDDSDSTVAIKDTTSTSSKQLYKITSAPTAAISSFEFNSVSVDAGFESWYSFNLTLDTASPEEFWVEFDCDGDFDAIPGPAYQIDDYGDIVLIPAMNANGEPALCYASHWIVSCYVNQIVAKDETVTLWVLLKNGQDVGSFKAYITDDDSILIYKPFYSEESQSISFVNSLKTSIDLHFAVSNPTDETETKVDLQLQAFVDIEAKAGDTLLVLFPDPYNLELFQGSSVLCSLVYNNSDGNSNSVTTIIKESDCYVEGNTVWFTLDEDQTFSNTNWTLFNILGVDTPSGGFKRDKWIYEKDTLDFASGSFSILYSDSDKTFAGASFDNLNAAFTEFNKITDYVRIVVNEGMNIPITPGVFSGPFIIKSEDGDITALQINLKATVDVEKGEKNGIYLSNDGIYSLDYMNVETGIYIGAETGTPFGLYYIRWEMEENSFNSDKSKYLKPRATVVEVSYKNTYEIVFDFENIYVSPGYSSLPTTVSIDIRKRFVIPNKKYSFLAFFEFAPLFKQLMISHF